MTALKLFKSGPFCRVVFRQGQFSRPISSRPISSVTSPSVKNLITFSKLKDKMEEKKRMERHKINPKRRKGVFFGMPSVNLKSKHVDEFGCKRYFYG